MKGNYVYITMLLFSVGCSKVYDPKLEEALSAARENRGELEKVLAHYSAPSDSLQLKAAQFLITHMPRHFGYYGKEINRYAKVFSSIDSLSAVQETVTNDDKMHMGDSVIKREGQPTEDQIEKIMDIRLVTAPFLINNIDFTFKAWTQASWKNEVSFPDFCEFILPYRIRDERLEYWRPQLYLNYSRMAAASGQKGDLRSIFNYMNGALNVETDFTVYFAKYFPFTQSVGDIVKGRIGGCETTAFFAAAAMRSAGLPVALDYIPYWGNANSRHYMVQLVDRAEERTRLTNQNRKMDTWHLVDFSSEYNSNRHSFTEDEFPQGMYIQYVRTIPKVYRFSYIQSSSLLDINRTVDSQYICPAFRKTNLQDVTAEYLETADVHLAIDDYYRKYQVAYLSVFNVNGWEPVAITRIENGEACFKDVGKEVLYILTVFDNGQQIPVSNPFYIDDLNFIHLLKRTERTTDLKLYRKFPLFSYTAYHSEILKGGRFEAANSPDFRDAVTLGQIDYYPFYMNQMQVSVKGKFRYFRYVAPPGATIEPDNIAEVRFYGKGGHQPLKGTLIGSPGTDGHGIDKAFDGDMATYYLNASGNNGWIGIDLGAGNAQEVSHIALSPRNDTNCMIPGDEYELLYWNGEWVSAGTKVAQGDCLQYHNIPANTLYWLRDLSGGREERIFTYENGRQQWW